MAAHKAQVKKERKQVENEHSRAYQEHKRLLKQAAKDVEAQHQTTTYLETKENSEWHTENKRTDMEEYGKPTIEANIEKHRTLAEYNMAEKEREKEETVEA